MGITPPVSKPISIFSIPYYTSFSILLQYLGHWDMYLRGGENPSCCFYSAGRRSFIQPR